MVVIQRKYVQSIKSKNPLLESLLQLGKIVTDSHRVYKNGQTTNLDIHNVSTLENPHIGSQLGDTMSLELTREHVPRSAAITFRVCHIADLFVLRPETKSKKYNKIDW